MFAGERIRNMVKGRPMDRLPVMEWAPIWDVTLNRWISEGLDIKYECYGQYWRDIQLQFGLDANIQTCFLARTPNVTPTAKTHGAGILRSEKEYQEIKKTMYADPSLYLSKDHLKFLEDVRKKGDTMLWCTVDGFFWLGRELLGIEDHLYSFYDQPELLKRICEDYIEWLKKVFEFVRNTFIFDFMSFAEDMSYNNGPMIGKDVFDEFLAPYYREIIPMLKKLDIPVFIDSDGDITMAVDWYAEVGADGMFPLERQAGVDVALYLKKQPQMVFLGHFDKTCMKHGEERMREEFERLLPSMKSMRFIPSVDHQTPPDVSLANYRIYVRLLREYVEKAMRDK